MLKNLYLRVAPWMRAECGEDMEAHWHLLKVAPQNERISAAHLWARMHKFTASEHLQARGFGVYAPEYIPSQSHKQPMFPGYVFIWVWDIHRHWRRIISCPGVIRIACNEGNPVIVPDYEINCMQEVEGLVGRKRRARRGWRTHAVADTEEEKLVIRCYSALDSNQRIGALHRALGLATDSSPV